MIILYSVIRLLLSLFAIIFLFRAADNIVRYFGLKKRTRKPQREIKKALRTFYLSMTLCMLFLISLPIINFIQEHRTLSVQGQNYEEVQTKDEPNEEYNIFLISIDFEEVIEEDVFLHEDLFLNGLGYSYMLFLNPSSRTFTDLRGFYIQNLYYNDNMSTLTLNELSTVVETFYNSLDFTCDKTVEEIDAETLPLSERQLTSPLHYMEEFYARESECGETASLEVITQIARSGGDAFNQLIDTGCEDKILLTFYSAMSVSYYRNALIKYQQVGAGTDNFDPVLANYRIAEIYLKLLNYCSFDFKNADYNTHFLLCAESYLLRAGTLYSLESNEEDINLQLPLYDRYMTEIYYKIYTTPGGACENIKGAFYTHANSYINSAYATDEGITSCQFYISMMESIVSTN